MKTSSKTVELPKIPDDKPTEEHVQAALEAAAQSMGISPRALELEALKCFLDDLAQDAMLEDTFKHNAAYWDEYLQKQSHVTYQVELTQQQASELREFAAEWNDGDENAYVKDAVIGKLDGDRDVRKEVPND